MCLLRDNFLKLLGKTIKGRRNEILQNKDTSIDQFQIFLTYLKENSKRTCNCLIAQLCHALLIYLYFKSFSWRCWYGL